MAFIPTSDYKNRGLRYLGPDGANAQRPDDLRNYVYNRNLALARERPTRDDIANGHAALFENKPAVFVDRMSQLNRDFPRGGKAVAKFEKERSDSWGTPASSAVFREARGRRLRPLELPPETVARFWSEGCSNQREAFARNVSQQTSAIRFFNQQATPPPLVIGYKPVANCGNRQQPVVADHCIAGFPGVGNVHYGEANERPCREAAMRNSAVSGRDLPFYGERKT